MTNTAPTTGAADLPEAGCSKHHLIHCSQCRHDNMVRDLRAENARLTTQLAALAAGQATAAQAGAPANMRLCYSCGHPADAHPWVNDPRGGKRRGDCPAAPAQPVAQQGAADGFFLLLPQRPKPEAPAGTAGLDWDAYSGAQMLAFGRECSDAAIAALRAEQPAPSGAGHEQALEEALRERDEADDFIDTLLDEVLGADRAEWSSAYGRADALEDVRERITALHKPAVDRAWTQFEAATKQGEKQ